MSGKRGKRGKNDGESLDLNVPTLEADHSGIEVGSLVEVVLMSPACLEPRPHVYLPEVIGAFWDLAAGCDVQLMRQ